jgi:hypothetical protein
MELNSVTGISYFLRQVDTKCGVLPPIILPQPAEPSIKAHHSVAQLRIDSLGTGG